MTTDKIHFTQEKETNLLMLYAKAVQSQWQNPIMPDPWAEEAIRHIDYDFSKERWNKIWNKSGSMIVAIRARNFDLLTASYLADHPEATVLHLGCGLDTRVFRVDPPASVNWFDVDYPDVIEVRRKLYPERPGYRLIGTSLEHLHWLDEVPVERHALIVAEGVLMYLSEGNVKALLNALTRHFPGGQMVFDAVNSWAVRKNSNVAGTGASFKWAVDDPQDIKKLEPELDLIKEFKSPQLVAYSRLPLAMRALVRGMDLFPAMRNNWRLLLFRF